MHRDRVIPRRRGGGGLAEDPLQGHDVALRGQDLETTRRACAKYRNQPALILNFLEGTRFTAAKHEQQASPYVHLLRPKAEPSLEERRKSGFAAWYYRVGTAAIRHRWAFLAASFAVLVASGGFVRQLKTQFFPADLQYHSFVDIWLPEDAPVAATDPASSLRVIAGDQTGYAYSDDLSPEKILKAARIAARIASGEVPGPLQGAEIHKIKRGDEIQALVGFSSTFPLNVTGDLSNIDSQFEADSVRVTAEGAGCIACVIVRRPEIRDPMPITGFGASPVRAPDTPFSTLTASGRRNVTHCLSHS